VRKLATTTNIQYQNMNSSQTSKRSILNNIKKPPKNINAGRDFVIKQKIIRRETN
jgi:hypothetical protein